MPAGATWMRSIRRLNATIWLDREGAEAGRPRGGPRGAREGVARPAARRADDAQGHVLPGGQALHLRLGAAQGFPSRHHGDGDRAAERGRRLHVRRPEHGGVRAEPDRPQSRVRRLPQSLEPALHHRRLVIRLRRLGGGALQLHGAGLRYRRFDPPAGGGLRRHRPQADADPRVALRRHAAVVQRRQCRAAGPHRARLRTRHDADRRPRSARPDQFARAGAGLRGGTRRRRAWAAHRPATTWFLDDVDPPVLEAMERAVAVLVERGARCSRSPCR